MPDPILEKDNDEIEGGSEKLIPTYIPDHSLVTSQIWIVSQSVGIEYSELADHFDWIRDQATRVEGVELLKKGIGMTMNNLHTGDQKWDEIVQKEQDERYTMMDCIEAEAISCFHRSVFLNTLMQQASMSLSTVDGSWIDSTRADLREQPKEVIGAKRGVDSKPLFLDNNDPQDAHVWNLAQIGDDVYLVDSSYLIRDGDAQVPVIHKIDYAKDRKDYSVSLPDGRTRHYIIEGPVRVRQNPISRYDPKD